jgi:hypothetical protein
MSPALIAWFGHSGSHDPQLMQFSVIIIAMEASFGAAGYLLRPRERGPQERSGAVRQARR